MSEISVYDKLAFSIVVHFLLVTKGRDNIAIIQIKKHIGKHMGQMKN